MIWVGLGLAVLALAVMIGLYVAETRRGERLEAAYDDVRKEIDDLNAAILSWQNDVEAFVRGEELPSTGRHASRETQEGV